MKVVVTSQKYLKLIPGRVEETEKEVEDIKRKMAAYTEDISLNKLSNEDSLKFFTPSLVGASFSWLQLYSCCMVCLM